jgi:Fungal Zn(2)-Cys(6) binuclear cluster domain
MDPFLEFDLALPPAESFATMLPLRIVDEADVFLTASSSDSRDVRPLQQQLVKRRPIPSKGHTKSRKGCYSCKRRKIKCQETLPQCGHCLKAGYVCQYPTVGARTGLTMVHPEDPPAFRGIDMRFFHHFLTTAYPYIPVRADTIWTHQVPSFAHEVRLGA